MKNQKSVLHLRVYSSYGNNSDLAFNRAGKILNPNQLIKMQYQTLEYDNLMKNIQYLGYVKWEVEKILILNKDLEWEESKEPKDKYQHELNVAFYGKDEAIKMLDSVDEEEVKEEVKELTELEQAKQDYIDEFGKKPHHSWGVEQLKQKIAEQ